MPKTIIVKPGETLWGLAQRELGSGTRWKELGAQIGITTEAQARLLKPGTVLTIPESVSPVPTPEKIKSIAPTLAAPSPAISTLPPAILTPQDEIVRKKKEIEEKVKEIGEATALLEKAKAARLEPTEEIPEWVIAAKTPEEVAELRKPKRIEELEKLAYIPPKTYEETFKKAYKTAGLENSKKKIEGLDAKILKTRQDVYAGEAEITENPWLSEAGRVGRTRKLYEMAEKKIKNLLTERKSLVEEYKTGVKAAEETAKMALKDWERRQKLYKEELDYLTRTEKGEEIISWSDLEKINAKLPVGKKLPYGTTKAEAVKMEIVPEKMEKKWTEFTNQEKRKLTAIGIDWTTKEGFKKAMEYLYPEKEEKWEIERRAKRDMAIQIESVKGRDGYISPENWKIAKNAWTEKGLLPEDFIKQFYGYINPDYSQNYGIREQQYLKGEESLF